MNVLLFLMFYYCNGYYYRGYSKWLRQSQGELNLNQTFFPSLRGYQVNANDTTELVYPWIARVVHSHKNLVPFMCTATCVAEGIFITAARCVYLLKVKITSVIYQVQRLRAKAFVMPSKETKQMFDDIGFIVVQNGFSGKWAYLNNIDVNRTDNEFKWLNDPKFSERSYRAVGYTTDKVSFYYIPPALLPLPWECEDKKYPKIKQALYPIWNNIVRLTDLDVVFDMNICREMMTEGNIISGFNVPCYHSCSLSEVKKVEKKDKKSCENYHGVLGGLVYSDDNITKTQTILGVATWGAYYRPFELPVGIAIPNTETYYTDLICAQKIQQDRTIDTTPGHYQRLCDAK